jgi:hypothetical protein
VVEVLNTREHFAQLKLVNGMSAGDRFEALPPISRIRILTVEALPELWTGGFLGWMKQVVRASPHLEWIPFLSMNGCAQMCEILEQEKVRLKDVSILSPHPAFLHYLASYSGLERLEIADVFPDAHGQMLWERVVPKHKASLVVLICPGVSEGLCSFGEHNVKLISQLRKLEMLEISVNSSEMAPKVGKGERDVVVRLLSASPLDT